MAGRHPDRQFNSVARQGAMDGHMTYDIVSKVAIQAENRRRDPSAYRGAEHEAVWHINEHEIVFARLSGAGLGGDTRAKVLSALNGFGVEETRRYGADAEMLQLAVANKIRPLGVAVLGVDAGPGQHDRGLSVQLAGLNTVYQGPIDGESIRPGDLVYAAMPKFTENVGAMPQPEPGIPGIKYRLVPRPLRPEHPARALVRHSQELVRDPVRWRGAMGDRLRQTDMWAAAVTGLLGSYQTAALLSVAALVEAGWLEPSGALLRVLGARGGAAAAAPRAVPAAGGDVAADVRAERRAAGQDTAAVLAEVLGLSASSAFAQALTATQVRDAKLLRARLAQTLFFDGQNVDLEFGARQGGPAPGMWTSLAKHAPSGEVKSNDPYGALLQAQLNHLMVAATSFYDAHQTVLASILGKATTGANPEGSNRAHVAFGICHP